MLLIQWCLFIYMVIIFFAGLYYMFQAIKIKMKMLGIIMILQTLFVCYLWYTKLIVVSLCKTNYVLLDSNNFGFTFLDTTTAGIFIWSIIATYVVYLKNKYAKNICLNKKNK